MEAVVVLFVILFIISMLAFTVWANQRRKATWNEFAERLGLQSDGTSITGEVRDVQVHIYTETRGSGKNRSTYTIFEAQFPDGVMPVNVQIYREGMLSKLGKVFGGQDVEIGIPEVDSRVIIKGQDVDAVRSYLTRPDVSRGLVDLLEACRDLHVDLGQVTLEFPGAMSNDDRMQRILDLLVDGTRAVGGRGYGALKYDGQW